MTADHINGLQFLYNPKAYRDDRHALFIQL